jgi:phosphoglycolate phosphatase-like HAD superfamily hydrolase
LLIEALGRNGVIGRNITCLTNAYSLSESINVKAIIKEAIDSVVNKGIKGVVFDFDYTLFNTDGVQEVRSIARHTKGTSKQKALAWEQAYQQVGKCIPYSGIKELLSYLQQKQIPCCVVSMCKPEFVTRTLAAFGMPDMAVYGASRPYMPKSKGMSKFVASIGADPQECISIGDRASDGTESQKAGIKFLGCSWGQGHDDDIITNGMKSPMEVIKYIESLNRQKLK